MLPSRRDSKSAIWPATGLAVPNGALPFPRSDDDFPPLLRRPSGTNGTYSMQVVTAYFTTSSGFARPARMAPRFPTLPPCVLTSTTGFFGRGALAARAPALARAGTASRRTRPGALLSAADALAPLATEPASSEPVRTPRIGCRSSNAEKRRSPSPPTELIRLASPRPRAAVDARAPPPPFRSGLNTGSRSSSSAASFGRPRSARSAVRLASDTRRLDRSTSGVSPWGRRSSRSGCRCVVGGRRRRGLARPPSSASASSPPRRLWPPPRDG